MVDNLTADALATPGLDFQMVTLMMLPEERERALELIERARGTADETWLARFAEADAYFEDTALRIPIPHRKLLQRYGAEDTLPPVMSEFVMSLRSWLTSSPRGSGYWRVQTGS